jgi:hypothetical protein
VAYLVGAMLALAVGGLATAVGLDRDRAFYPTVLIVIASYYALFAVVGESTHALVVEAVVAAAFLTVAIVGFRYSLWLVVAGLAAHGILDIFHGQVSPIQAFRPGGPHSVSRTTLWLPGTSPCSCSAEWLERAQPDANLDCLRRHTTRSQTKPAPRRGPRRR